MSFGQTESKSYRMIKIKRKPNEYEDAKNELEDDYVLEKEGDIKQFLQANNSKKTGPRYDNNGNLILHSVIGPASLFSSAITNHESAIKKTQSLNKRKKRVSNVNPEARFNQLLDQISVMRKSTVKEEKKKLKLASQRQQLLETRQNTVMQSFQKTENYWKTLENNLAVKSKKKLNELLYSRSINSRPRTETPEKSVVMKGSAIEGKLMWMMKLRDSENDVKYEAFVNVGNPLSGLYTRIQHKKESQTFEDIEFEEGNEEIANCRDLQVVGLSKLPLEIDAVQRMGCEHLRPDLLERGGIDETIVEQYDKKTKASLL